MISRQSFRAGGALVALLMVSGCADVGSGWDGAMSYVGLYPSSDDASAAPAVASAAPRAEPAPQAKADTWCRQAAQNTETQAAEDGFDAATQQRRAATAYQQCVELGGGPAER